MGYHWIWKKNRSPITLGRVAFGVLEKSLGEWQRGYSRANPEPQVEMITQLCLHKGATLPLKNKGFLNRARNWFGML